VLGSSLLEMKVFFVWLVACVCWVLLTVFVDKSAIVATVQQHHQASKSTSGINEGAQLRNFIDSS